MPLGSLLTLLLVCADPSTAGRQVEPIVRHEDRSLLVGKQPLPLASQKPLPQAPGPSLEAAEGPSLDGQRLFWQ